MMAQPDKFLAETCNPLELLLNTTATLKNLAIFMTKQELDLELRCLYAELTAVCFITLDQVKRLKHVIHPENLLLTGLLEKLESIVGTPVPHKDQQQHKQCSNSGLLSLISCWHEMKDAPDNTTLDFVRHRFDFATASEKLGQLKNSLQIWSDQALKLYPEDTSEWSQDDLAPKRNKRREPPDTVCRATEALFRALVASRDCSCSPSHQLTVTLRLGTYCKHNRDEDFDFDMFLALEKVWQEARILSAKRQIAIQQPVKRRAIQWAADGSSRPSRQRKTQRPGSVPTQIKNLCQPIKSMKLHQLLSRRLELLVDQNQLWILEPEKSDSKIDATKSPISLHQFINRNPGGLTFKTRCILAVMLGYAVFHLHETQWLHAPWGSSDILFFQTTDNSIPLRPFLRIQLGEEIPRNSQDVNTYHSTDEVYSGLEGLISHPYPNLLTLAVLLMEIHMAMPFEELAKRYGVQLPEGVTGKPRLLDVEDVFEKWEAELPQYLKVGEAVNRCLDPAIWENENGLELEKQTMRTVLYEEVVRLLEDDWDQAYGVISIEDLDNSAKELDLGSWGQVIEAKQTDDPMIPRTLGRSGKVEQHPQTSDPKLHLNPMALPAHGYDSSQSQAFKQERYNMSRHHDMYGPQITGTRAPEPPHKRDVDYTAFKFFDDESLPEDVLSKAQNQYLCWKEDFKRVYKKFVANRPHTPVRIAVLDTGLDVSQPDIEAQKEQIKAKRNWINTKTKDKVFDRVGHGTHIAGLLLDFAPDAELFIGKIAEDQLCEPRIIVEAINYAVNVWQVDIISMSFGFPQWVDGFDELQTAIKNAYIKDVLLFAAASNNGANQDRAYPARFQEVICIHSTDTQGNRSNFSPNPATDDTNFATVGEAVQSAWPVAKCDEEINDDFVECKSGTSFATPIAAGMGAFLLQYSRIYLKEELQKRLKGKAAMKAVLRKIATKTGYSKRDDYHYLSMSLRPDNLFGKEESFITQVMADEIERS